MVSEAAVLCKIIVLQLLSQLTWHNKCSSCKMETKYRCMLVGKHHLKFNRPCGTQSHPKHTHSKILLTEHSTANIYLPFDLFYRTSPSGKPFYPFIWKTIEKERQRFEPKSFPINHNNRYLHVKPLRFHTAGQIILYKSFLGEVIHWHKPPKTACSRSIAITQVMNDWELLMLYHIIYLQTTLVCNRILILCMCTIIPDNQRKAFITETALSSPSTDDYIIEQENV